MGYNVAMGVRIGGVYHYRNDSRCGIEGAKGKLIALSLEERNHCIKSCKGVTNERESRQKNVLRKNSTHVELSPRAFSVTIGSAPIPRVFGVRIPQIFCRLSRIAQLRGRNVRSAHSPS